MKHIPGLALSVAAALSNDEDEMIRKTERIAAKTAEVAMSQFLECTIMGRSKLQIHDREYEYDKQRRTERTISSSRQECKTQISSKRNGPIFQPN